MLMDALPHPNQRRAEPADDVIIEISGSNAFNNDILADYLNEQKWVVCFGAQDTDPRPVSSQPQPVIRLIFFDCIDIQWPAIKTRIAYRLTKNTGRNLSVCFNVDPGFQIEQAALRLGVRGVIYKDASTDMFPRAADAILDGQLWYPRKVLQRILRKPDALGGATNAEAASLLTRRELTILKLIAAGIRNREIADNLCISPHTVKTHIHNLFRKINVTNRFQATLWLTRNR
jgi:DNA-binding NarL/FixJ family response regulator